MKFAKQLDDEAIPEWRGNYLNYKVAKKRLKAVGRAIRSVANSSRPRTTPGSSFRDTPALAFLRQNKKETPANPGRSARQLALIRSNSDSQNPRNTFGGDDTSDLDPPRLAKTERSPLKSDPAQNNGYPQPHRMVSYGSIIGSPPNSPALRLKQASTLELPGTAVNVNNESDDDHATDSTTSNPPSPRSRPQTEPYTRPANELAQPRVHGPPSTQLGHRGNAYDIHPAIDVNAGLGTNPVLGLSRTHSKRTSSMPHERPFMNRMFSIAGTKNNRSLRDNNDIALEAYQELDFRKAEFSLFLDKELLKIETFYKSKEDEAAERLEALREQLHVMRSYRLQEILASERRHRRVTSDAPTASNGENIEDVSNDYLQPEHNDRGNSDASRSLTSHRLIRPFAKSIDIASDALGRVRTGHVGKTSEAMGNLGTPTLRGHWQPDADHRDYSRTPLKDVPYRVAKRKMKLALAEFYRGLELLKSYALLNRTAFRKINKKYDKTVDAQQRLQYMDEKVNKAHFVMSDRVDAFMAALEDLYARYFERGNRKIAVSKLRAKVAKAGDNSTSVARTCALVGAGAVFAIQATVYGARNLYLSSDIARVIETEYLLQLYAGYFLVLLLAGIFCLDAGIFTKYKVNYPFIFELDNRHHLNWLQLCEIPAWLFFIFGLTMWLNFLNIGGDAMYLYWFVILIAVSVIFLFMPAPIFYHRARSWLLYSTWRLLAAGIYPVEFRDFFLGDMFCSLTYAMGNIELFFCLYTRNWKDEVMCNSSNSRLLGFLSTLPGIWRALQCLRRYWDTRNAFPHLANCAKYVCTILMYMSLSLYRIDKVPELKAFFIACATVNAAYTSVWDIFMDWSLGDFKTKRFGLRPVLVYEKQFWIYYLALPVDVLIRFNWIFYALYTEDLQHSTLVSFFVAFSEVLRRGLWTLFRVENEQCTNITNFRASRNIALPYSFPATTSTETLLREDQSNPSRPGDPSNVDGQGLTGVEESRQNGELGANGVQFSSRNDKSRSAESSQSGKSADRDQDDNILPPPVPRQPSPQLSRGSHPSPGKRNDAATPFRLLGVRFWNPVTKEVETQPSPASADSGRDSTRPRPARTESQIGDRHLKRTDTSGSGGLVTSLQRIGDSMRSAHAQDYEKRKKPADKLPLDDSDEEDEDEDESEGEE